VATASVAVALTAGCSAGQPAHRSFNAPEPEPSAGLPLGNRVGDLDPAAVLQRAKTATAAAAYVHVKGDIKAKTGKADAFSVDMKFSGTGSEGSINEGARPTRVTRVQNQVWFQGDEKFWKEVDAPSAVAYREKYIQIPVNDRRFTGIVESTYIDNLVNRLLGKPGELTKNDQVQQINGHSAISLTDKATGSVIWVSTQGAPYLLRLEGGKTAKTTGSVDFIGYDERTVIQAPDPDKVVDKDLAPGGRKSTTKPSPTGSTRSTPGRVPSDAKRDPVLLP
jgi:hypothetical protein